MKPKLILMLHNVLVSSVRRSVHQYSFHVIIHKHLKIFYLVRKLTITAWVGRGWITNSFLSTALCLSTIALYCGLKLVRLS